MPAYVGTSGWQYRHWRGVFYPRPARGLDELALYAARYASVELNGSFYRLPEASTFAGWAARTPADFVFAVRASRYLTHVRRLRDPAEPVRRLMDRAGRLSAKLGPVLLQLPPTLHADAGLLRDVLRAFNHAARVAVECRHESWFTDETRRVLEQEDAALCLADRGSRWLTPMWRTANWGYVRFHWGSGEPESCYTTPALEARAHEIARLWPGEDLYVYFNNDPHACALRDASLFAAFLERDGIDCARTPAAIAV